ncbi:histidine kinase dimerization/phosphoacceptor domain-containing protein [Pseudonocardia zijingensis]|jgi:two-component system sensor histidine kinase DesK|uniref:Signal transduction histidine kinase subgroup 3 dimerisation and phosphoacceptor domain-containing protein n=1 Tax=Pseudonocardia zijingensis TaxID=153376 RepID=A0ABN1QWJ6_9PSEU
MTRAWRQVLCLAAGAVVVRCAVSTARARREVVAVRAELVAVAADRERLRATGDVLGQTLSAVSLKGDLAVRLLGHDPVAAREEVAGLADMARRALREVRTRTAGELVASLSPARIRRGGGPPPPRG